MLILFLLLVSQAHAGGTLANVKNEQLSIYFDLEFTGNWFLDAGILGFVELMEEVYRWDLDELRKRIKKEPEKVYYGYFPMAYVYANNLKSGEQNLPTPKTEIIDNARDSFDIFNKGWSWISNNFKEVKTKKNGDQYPHIKIKDKGIYYYFHNFLFFQSSSDEEKQKKDFLEILGLKKMEEDVLLDIDKTLNKFLPSIEKFPNISYNYRFVKVPKHFYKFIITFPLGFITKKDKNSKMMIPYTFFYSNNLEITKIVNKTFRIKIQSKEVDRNSIFRLTWESIIDSFVEMKSSWSLENMYIIQYMLGKNQVIFDVEFIGIPKLQANVISDDTIRANLNHSVPVREIKSKNYDYKWLLEEFLKENSLYPLAIEHVNLAANGKINLSKRACIYSLAVESAIAQYKEKDERLFSPDFFGKYEKLKETPSEIKKMASRMFWISSLMSNVFSQEISENKNFIFELFTPLKKRDRKIFVNTLLKNLVNKENSKEIVHYLFETILSNDETWEYYALPIVIGLIGRNENE